MTQKKQITKRTFICNILPSDYIIKSKASQAAINFCNRLVDGKCLLAFQRKPEVIKDILKEIDFKPLTEYTITSPQKYLKELKRVKNIGYAVDFQEDSIYQICIAAPIFNHNKNVVAAISCTFLYDTNLRIKEIGEEMKRIALTISKKLGYIDDTGRRNIHGK